MWRIIKYELNCARLMILYSIALTILYYAGVTAGWWTSLGFSGDTGAWIIFCTVWMTWVMEMKKSNRFAGYAKMPLTLIKLGIARVLLVFLFFAATFWIEPAFDLVRNARLNFSLIDFFQIFFYSFIVFGIIISGDLRAVLSTAGRKGTALSWCITTVVLLVILVAVVMIEKQTNGKDSAVIQTCIVILVETILAASSVIIFKSRKDFIR